VAANNWATAASSAAGPIGAKSAILMKNALIFVAKHTKNLAKMGHGKARERGPHQHSNYIFFPACLLLLLQHSLN
jgi:hypothetical protein